VRRYLVGAIALVSAVAFAATALGQGTASRQSASLKFTVERPNAATGVRIAIDYRNPNDPDAKPFAVRRVVTELARGSRTNTRVPARCGASDAQLMAQGAGACPDRSIVGGGRLSTDNGVPGPSRMIRNRVTLINNRRELIFLTRSTNTPAPMRLVVRADAEGRKTTTTVPPVPGGPPDGFLAIDRVKLRMQKLSRRIDGERRAYVRTPHSCPGSERWVSAFRFGYRDGVTQTVTSRTPCRHVRSRR